MEIKPYGEQALIVDFDQSISEIFHHSILSIQGALHNDIKSGLIESIPGYQSLVIVFDPSLTSFDHIKSIIENFGHSHDTFDQPSVTYTLPVCYDATFSLDMDRLKQRLGLSSHEIINLHTDKDYKIYATGFIPGFNYLGTLVDPLFGKRLSEPRKRVPQGAVGIAGRQTGIYPLASPGGWEILGRCPVPCFLPEAKNSFPFKVGDYIRFKAIDLEDFEHWSNTDWDHFNYESFRN